MNIQDYNKAITLLIHLIVQNNAGAVARALKQHGYDDTKNYIPRPELEAALLQLYMADHYKFFELMRSISWNYGDTDTNKPEVRDELIKLSGIDPETETNKENWWQILIDLISKQENGKDAYNQSNDCTKNTVIIVALTLVSIAIVVTVFYIIKRFL